MSPGRESDGGSVYAAVLQRARHHDRSGRPPSPLRTSTPASVLERAFIAASKADRHGKGAPCMTGGPKQNSVGSSQATPVAQGHFPEANAIRVLLIEDDELYRNNLASELAERGFAVR